MTSFLFEENSLLENKINNFYDQCFTTSGCKNASIDLMKYQTGATYTDPGTSLLHSTSISDILDRSCSSVDTSIPCKYQNMIYSAFQTTGPLAAQCYNFGNIPISDCADRIFAKDGITRIQKHKYGIKQIT